MNKEEKQKLQQTSSHQQQPPEAGAGVGVVSATFV